MPHSIPEMIGLGGACGGGILCWGAVAPSAQLFGPTLRRTGDPGAIALTFDDGPNPAITPRLLDVLDRHGVAATFFQIGERVRAFPALASEICRRGHSIGNHTDNHPRLVFLSGRSIAGQLHRCAAALESATGHRTQWMRPPYGYRGPQLQSSLRQYAPGYRVVMWSASARDWRAQSSQQIIERLRRVKGGDIVLLHDGDHRSQEADRRHTLAGLEYWLPRWKQAGLRFVSLDNLDKRKSQVHRNG